MYIGSANRTCVRPDQTIIANSFAKSMRWNGRIAVDWFVLSIACGPKKNIRLDYMCYSCWNKESVDVDWSEQRAAKEGIPCWQKINCQKLLRTEVCSIPSSLPHLFLSLISLSPRQSHSFGSHSKLNWLCDQRMHCFACRERASVHVYIAVATDNRNLYTIQKYCWH